MKELSYLQWMLRRSTLQLLRFHFSFFLMPVYWFALSQVVYKNWPKALLIFFILHGLVYPASNGYNSYMDRDMNSIGGLKHPQQPTRELYLTTVWMDIAAILLGILIGPIFALGVLAYIIASRLYSYKGIRLKKYPITGYLLVVIFQGAVTFFLVYHGSHANKTVQVPVAAMIGSSLLIGGFYPLTQVYQHQEDLNDGVKTISWLLGYRGTFLFAAVVYFLAFVVLGFYFFTSLEIKEFFVLATALLPVLVYFLIWAINVWKNSSQANFINTMRMNVMASFCTNTAFIIILLMEQKLAKSS